MFQAVSDHLAPSSPCVVVRALAYDVPVWASTWNRGNEMGSEESAVSMMEQSVPYSGLVGEGRHVADVPAGHRGRIRRRREYC